MEENLLYRPPKHRGLYLDPRTKLLFLFVLATLLFLLHENLPLNSILVLIPILLLLSDHQYRPAWIYGGLFIACLLYTSDAADD